ncbi:hypothetical protein ACIGNX_27620 [Actinosynnema sp. NPDC053489]|uniref:hypothetical protein n=1 Tax=Actinosynnema sp. NPDC053489 TaxID=3363916 RepID=UPI0037C8B020
MSLRFHSRITSDRRRTPAKKTPPVLVSSAHESRQESISMSDGEPRHHTDHSGGGAMNAATTADFTAANFPTPHLALRGTADETAVRAFADEQARAARQVYAHVALGLVGLTVGGRVAALNAAYDAVVRWRRSVAAVADDARYDASGRPAVERYSVTLEQGGPNYDRLGVVGRFRRGSRWDESTRTFVGGEETPASRIVAVYGDAALRRFAVEAPRLDLVRNRVALPVSGGVVWGNELVRGEAADLVGALLAARVTARRGVAEVETGGAPLYTITADTQSRRTLFAEAMTVLATAERGDWTAWWNAAYLLYQAPQFKKGSDACNRVFLVAVGAALLGAPPVLPHDLDLRCMVLGQTTVTATPLLCGVSDAR